MAESALVQDEANPVFWLATRVGKMGLSCPLRISWHWKSPPFGHIKKFFIDQASLVMTLDIALILFGIFIYLDFISVHKNAMGNGQYPALLTARLVNNAYHSIHSLNLSLPCFNFQSHQNQPSSVSYPVWEFFSPHVWSWYGWTTKNNKNNQKNDFTNLR